MHSANVVIDVHTWLTGHWLHAPIIVAADVLVSVKNFHYSYNFSHHV